MSHQNPSPPEDEKPSPWFPTAMCAEKTVFLMDATHRGDMYHMRAAMALFDYSLCLYNCSDATQDLVDYLKRSVKAKKHVFLVPWPSEVLYNEAKPTQMHGCTLDGKAIDAKNLGKYKNSIFSENRATKEVKKAVNKSKGLPKTVSDGMVILQPASKKALGSAFEKLFRDVWDVKKPTILALYRKTGTVVQDNKPPGVYPELDTGDALRDIASLLPEKSGKKLRIISCGNESKLDGIPDDIGQYWLKFKNVKLDPRDTNGSKRDVEAYFLEWTFQKGYYQMATGFRSGPLDLFTFLGIPTVSIGLFHMVGETRHARLANEQFKRLNIQYDRPRHDATAYFQGSDGRVEEMASPFWVQDQPSYTKRKIPTDKKKEQETPPGDFSAFDKTILKIGYSIACEKYMGTAKSFELLKSKILNPFNSRAARYHFPVDLVGDEKEEQRIAYFEAQREVDRNDLVTMGNNKDHYQQSEGVFEKRYETPWIDDWKDIYTELGLGDS